MKVNLNEDDSPKWDIPVLNMDIVISEQIAYSVWLVVVDWDWEMDEEMDLVIMQGYITEGIRDEV
jgi:hypothetical protein